MDASLRIRGHKGPHPEAYHREVLKRITTAMQGCRGVAQCREALTGELQNLARDLLTPGTLLRNLVTKGKG